MRTLKQWADAHIKTSTFTVVPENPLSPTDWMAGTMHFHVVLTGERGAFSTYYSVGPGIVESWVKERYKGKLGNPKLPVVQRRIRELGAKFRPDVSDILECLQCDFGSVTHARSFEEWAGDLGYDEDSRAAEKIYNAVLRQRLDFETAFGIPATEDLIEICPDAEESDE